MLCREAGVRSLKQLLEKTYRKVALKLVRGGLSGPTPSNTQKGPAHPGDTVTEHGGVGLIDEDSPQQSPPDTAATTTDTSGESCLSVWLVGPATIDSVCAVHGQGLLLLCPKTLLWGGGICNDSGAVGWVFGQSKLCFWRASILEYQDCLNVIHDVMILV